MQLLVTLPQHDSSLLAVLMVTPESQDGAAVSQYDMSYQLLEFEVGSPQQHVSSL